MTAVKDQGLCGSCWAFTSNTALEGTLALKTGRAPLRLSEQHILECTYMGRRDKTGTDYDMWGCDGGWMAAAWDYQTVNGFITDADYPYTSGADDGGSLPSCKQEEKEDKVIGKVTGYRAERNVGKMLEQVKFQPMSIAIDAGSRDFSLYSGGVLKNT